MTSSRDQQLPDGPAELLAFAREQRAVADRAEANLLRAAVQWAVIHPAESVDEVETFHARGFGDTGIPVAGPGAPLVAEFSVAEFAAAVGLGTEAGKRYVGHAVELRYRLPKLWQRVTSGDLAAWKARRVAEDTLVLSPEAAAFVDRHVAPVAHQVKPAQLDRLVHEAITRHLSARAEEDRRRAWDQRHATIDYGSVGIAGTCQVTAELDLADAIDLDQALAADARQQADLGSVETLDQRRATALGNIARRDLTLEFPARDRPGESAPRKQPAPRARELVLHVHLSEAAISADRPAGVGRVENTRTPVTAETIRAWCGNPQARVVVKPVRDLAEHVHVEQYEVPDRIAEAVALRDLTCVFPWCTRPARRLKPDEHRADCDHQVAYAAGGPTCSCQIAALCRRHHRLKTHGGWRYHCLEPGTYLWTSPHRYQYLRDHTGTLDTSRDQHRCRPVVDPPPDPSPDDGPPAET